MKSLLEVCLVAFITITATAQDVATPKLRPGIHVQMPSIPSAVAIPDADQEAATVVAINENGKLFLGTKPVEIAGLSVVSTSAVYVKADARVNYQTVLNVLDALKGHQIVLLGAPGGQPQSQRIQPPYGVKLTFAGN